MASARGIRQVAYFDCAGGGQVRIDGTTAYIGHMEAPFGTSVVDVADPKKPSLLAQIEIPPAMHSHKVRAKNGLMVVNHEKTGPGPHRIPGGLGIYDVANPKRPRHITNWETAGAGVHRFDFDGRYVYISPTVEGYIGTILMILDLADPARPQEVGRWWIPGQWKAGGEDYPWKNGPAPRCHHPLRLGDRLYTSYWHHGCHIIDISDMAHPKRVGSLELFPATVHPQHTALPIPFPVRGRKLMVVADEDVAKRWPFPPAFMWIVDITDETRPVPIASYQIDGLDRDGTPQPQMTGCHQPAEIVTSTEIPVAWFAQGLRIIDIANPHAPQEVAYFVPDPAPGADRPSSNDITVDGRGLLYLVDRVRGLHVLERV
jgi:hypothetical protein